MIYISPQGDYPRHAGDIKLDNSNWQEGQELPIGWVAVEETPAPAITKGQVWFEVYPELVDGIYYQKFEVRDLTAEEIEARKVAEVKQKVLLGQPLTQAEAALLVG
jgi:hypothetical protein